MASFGEYEERLTIRINSDFSKLCGEIGNCKINKFLETINHLRARKTITLEVWLGIVFLATEIYSYNGDGDSIVAFYHIPLFAYDKC